MPLMFLPAGQDSYDSQLFGSSIIFEPLHYALETFSRPLKG
jgi:hypothetical protein